MKPFYLTLGAIFKNETWILKEWLDHYIAEGVEHFYLIDNGSTDDPRSILEPYIKSNVVTLFEDPERWAQTELYNRYLMPHKNSSEWLVVVDLDEFVYARNSFATTSSFLKECDKLPVSAIIVQWKMFGSSGHDRHPADKRVVSNFTMRKHYDGTKTGCGMQDASYISGKSIVRTSCLKSFIIHTHVLSLDNCLLSDFQETNNHYFQPVSEERLRGYNLHLNHYSVQSREFWEKIKMTRGAANTTAQENIRTWQHFDAFNENEIKDEELVQKKQGRCLWT